MSAWSLIRPLRSFLARFSREGFPATVAVLGPEMILAAAFVAMIAHLPGRHRHKITARSLDHLDVADHEFVIERHRTERLQPIIPVLDQPDSNLRYFHVSASPKTLPSVVPHDNTPAACPFGDDVSHAFELF